MFFYDKHPLLYYYYYKIYNITWQQLIHHLHSNLGWFLVCSYFLRIGKRRKASLLSFVLAPATPSYRGARRCSNSSKVSLPDPALASRTSPIPSASHTPPHGAPGLTTVAPPRSPLYHPNYSLFFFSFNYVLDLMKDLGVWIARSLPDLDH